ncbi:unnamed protein product [Prorocentrum cordatum]|uniref:Uncharacterized protein n=1 Tax=Prorocentrum cordatum TaxID=2364126 RepID=A0ABN9TNY1_9DINO|nr:unnamed protein product [Polarella glacialis]
MLEEAEELVTRHCGLDVLHQTRGGHAEATHISSIPPLPQKASRPGTMTTNWVEGSPMRATRRPARRSRAAQEQCSVAAHSSCDGSVKACQCSTSTPSTVQNHSRDKQDAN